MTKTAKYTLGEKIDRLFLETLECVFTAFYLPRGEKLPIIQKATTKLDLTKFFLQIAWEIKALDSKRYATLSISINEIGRMLGGWSRQVEAPTKTNPHPGSEKQ